SIIDKALILVVIKRKHIHPISVFCIISRNTQFYTRSTQFISGFSRNNRFAFQAFLYIISSTLRYVGIFKKGWYGSVSSVNEKIIAAIHLICNTRLYCWIKKILYRRLSVRRFRKKTIAIKTRTKKSSLGNFSGGKYIEFFKNKK